MPSPNPDQSSGTVSEMMERAEAAFGTGDLPGAIRACQQVLTALPDHRRAKEIMETAQSMLETDAFIKENLRRARDFYNARDFEKCINECQKIQILQPDDPTVTELMNQAQERLEAEPFVQNFIRSGQSLYDSGLYGEALAQWEKVRSIDPRYPDLQKLIDGVNEKMGGTSGGAATPLFDVHADPSSSNPSPGGFDELSLGTVEEGVTSEDDRIQQLLSEGDRLYGSEQYQKAIETWSEIFMLDVNHPTALQKIDQARAAANDQRNRMKETLKTAQRAYEQGNTRQAYGLFMQVKAIDPDNSEANKYLSMMETPAPSQESPADLKDLIALGESAQQSGQYREAAQYFSQALAIDVDNENLADAIRNLNLLAKKNEQTKALLGNARAFRAEGKMDSAYHAINKAMDLDPGNPEVQQMLQELKSPPPEPAVAKTQPLSVSAGAFKAAARSFPVLPVGIGAAVLIGLFLAYFFFIKGSPSANDVGKPIEKQSKTLTPPQNNKEPSESKPAATDPEITKKPAPNVEKAEQLAKQANFFYSEKKYTQAMKMAEEALNFDPENKEAISVKMLSQQALEDQVLLERKLLDDANLYFGYAEYVGAAKLYMKYMEAHPGTKPQVMPQLVKCYYNMGVIALRQWKCDQAADYFNQVTFLGENDPLSKEALEVARQCLKSGSSNFEVRKAVALLEIRK